MNTLRNALDYASWPIGRKFVFSLLLPVLLGPLITTLLLNGSGFGSPAGAPGSAPNALNPNLATQFAPLPLLTFLPSLMIAGLMWLPLNHFIIRQIKRLVTGVQRLAEGTYTEPVPATSQKDELGQLAGRINVLGMQLQRDFQDPEQRIAQRTRDLETAREIGQILSSIRDVEILANQVIELLSTRFEAIYHAQIFFVDDQGQDAVLRASTGDVGQSLLQRRHRLPVGGQSIVGQSITQGKPIVALDTATSPVHKFNALLPETRSELALPLRLGDAVIGALDVQSKNQSAFADSDIRLFQTIADQLAIAIQNAQLLEESQTRLREINELNKLLMGEAWGDFIQSRKRKQPSIARRDSENLTPLQRKAINSGQIAETGDEDRVQFAVPIILRGQALGAVEYELSRSTYNENTRLLATELAARLALAADNARLLEQSQQLAQRERLINDISNKLTQQTDVSQILQIAVRELGNALPVSQTSISLTGDAQ